MSSVLLINEPPLQVLPSLAERIGLNESIILQQVHYWIHPNHNHNIFENRHWVYNTYGQWRKQFKFWSKKTIERTILKLEGMGLLLSRTSDAREGRIKYYSIDYDVLNTIQQNNEDLAQDCDDTTSRQNDVTSSNTTSRQVDVRVTTKCREGHDNLTCSYIDTENTQRLPRERKRSVKNASPPEENKKATSLDINWTLPDTWREWSLEAGMFSEQIDRSEFKFRNYWLSIPKSKNSMNNWFLVWKNWCLRDYPSIKITKPNKYVPEPIKGEHSDIKPQTVKNSDDPKIQKWNELQVKLKDRIGESEYESWIERNTELISASERAIFKVRSTFIRDWLCNNYAEDLAAILSDIDPKLGKIENIDFIVDSG